MNIEEEMKSFSNAIKERQMDRELEDMGKQIFQNTSDVPIFCAIGESAKAKGFEVSYFKIKHPKLEKTNNGNFEFSAKHLHYVHIKKDNELQVSAYYDKYSLGSIMDRPYYELYDGDEIERFLETDIDEIALFDSVIKILKEVK